MLYSRKLVLTTGLFIIPISQAPLSSAQITAALSEGTVKSNFNLRFESVDQDNALEDAQDLTLSSKLLYTLVYDTSNMADQMTKDGDIARRREMFEGALLNIKMIAEAP